MRHGLHTHKEGPHAENLVARELEDEEQPQVGSAHR